MAYPELERCIEVVKALRHPQTGCPWDLEQTHQSLLKYLIEESYEFVEAVEENNPNHMEEEIGDVLFQVLLHTTIGEEKQNFSLETSAKVLADKLIRRHPHVFKTQDLKLTSEQVLENWQRIKIEEKGRTKYAINEKDLHAPALESSYKIGKKSTRVNFDWANYQQVLMKVEEEWQEVKVELPPTGQYNKERVQEEIGDLLFSVAQLARHLDLNPEECLRMANKKFIKRFNKVEDIVISTGKKIEETPQEELEELWVRVKKK
jgi:MazG family protein